MYVNRCIISVPLNFAHLAPSIWDAPFFTNPHNITIQEQVYLGVRVRPRARLHVDGACVLSAVALQRREALSGVSFCPLYAPSF